MIHYFKIPYFTCIFFTKFTYNEYIGPYFLSHIVLRFSPVISPSIEYKCDSPKFADSIKTSAFISTASYVSLHGKVLHYYNTSFVGSIIPYDQSTLTIACKHGQPETRELTYLCIWGGHSGTCMADCHRLAACVCHPKDGSKSRRFNSRHSCMHSIRQN